MTEEIIASERRYTEQLGYLALNCCCFCFFLVDSSKRVQAYFLFTLRIRILKDEYLMPMAAQSHLFTGSRNNIHSTVLQSVSCLQVMVSLHEHMLAEMLDEKCLNIVVSAQKLTFDLPLRAINANPSTCAPYSLYSKTTWSI